MMQESHLHNCLEAFLDKRVFITGHTGFKGSWLAFLLNEIGAEVMGFALPPNLGQSHFTLLGLDNRIAHVVGDVRDGHALESAVQRFQPEYVFHLAAQALVRPSYESPAATFETNVMGSVNLLEAVRQCGSVRSLVYITSDKCYENMEWTWGYRENDRLGGRDPYSASKAAAEIVFSSYARSFFCDRPQLGAATTRAGNVIGGGDWSVDRIIPDCIRAVERDQPIHLRNPLATRPWQHVLEPLWGYLLLAVRLREDPRRYAGSWNFGPSTREVRTVQSIVEMLIGHLGRGSVEIKAQERGLHESGLLQLNWDKAHQLLGWYPRWTIEESLKATAVWYKTILDGGNAEETTRAQILEFFPELT